MAMTGGSLRANASVRVTGSFPPQGVAGTLPDVVARGEAAAKQTLGYGTGDGQVDILVCQDVEIDPTTAETFDLYAGTDLKDAVGGTAAFRKVKYVGVFLIDGGDDSGVAVGGAGSDEWVGFFGAAGDTHTLFPGGPPYQAGSPAGVAVGASTKDFAVENLGAVAVTLRVVIAGTSV